MSGMINVAILDDHQSMLDGLAFRLSQSPNIAIVGTASFANELEPLLAGSEVDVLLLDIGVPTSPEDARYYPVPSEIPKLLERYPGLSILVITMHHESALIREVFDGGVSGYVLKDDGPAIRQIASIVESIAGGSTFFSEKANQALNKDGANALNLSERQLEILIYASLHPNLTSVEIADRLALAPSTVRNQLSRAYVTLGVRNLAAAIIKVRELGLVSPYQSAMNSGEN